MHASTSPPHLLLEQLQQCFRLCFKGTVQYHFFNFQVPYVQVSLHCYFHLLIYNLILEKAATQLLTTPYPHLREEFAQPV